MPYQDQCQLADWLVVLEYLSDRVREAEPPDQVKSAEVSDRVKSVEDRMKWIADRVTWVG
jgi:hypothetical protein